MGTMITYAEVENSIVVRTPYGLDCNTKSSLQSLERIHEFARLPAETSSKTPGSLDHSREQFESWPTDGTLEFRDVSVRYRQDLPLALNQVSFKVKGGLKLGVCGRSVHTML
jgi:ABC-type multidrug transport system fused ATPase/permease subunit